MKIPDSVFQVLIQYMRKERGLQENYMLTNNAQMILKQVSLSLP